MKSLTRCSATSGRVSRALRRLETWADCDGAEHYGVHYVRRLTDWRSESLLHVRASERAHLAPPPTSRRRYIFRSYSRLALDARSTQWTDWARTQIHHRHIRNWSPCWWILTLHRFLHGSASTEMWFLKLLLARLMGQYCFARWRLSSVVVVCNATWAVGRLHILQREEQVRLSSGTAVYPHMPILRPRAAPYSTNVASLSEESSSARATPIRPILGFWGSKVPKNVWFPTNKL